jgi:hypothetical protein
LTRLLHLARQREATDDRDKVFALLRLAGEEGGGIDVDYAAGVNEVYERTVRWLM